MKLGISLDMGWIPMTQPGFDPDAQAFFDASMITDGTEKNAINILVKDLKSHSLWAKIICFFPYVGSAAFPHSINLKNPATFSITWQSANITRDFNGWIRNGAGGYGKIVVSPSDLNVNSIAFGFYLKTDSGSMGADIAESSGALYRSIFFSDNNWYSDNTDFVTGRLVVAMAPPTRLGLFTSSRVSSSSIKSYRNSTALVSGSGVSGSIAALTSFDLGGDDVPHRYVTHFIAQGLSDAEMINLYNSVQTFQTTLGREEAP